jgi:trigger factor
LVACGSSSSGTVETEYGTVKLADYKGLPAYEDDIEVTDDELQSTIDSDLSSHQTTKTIKKGKVKKDSTVIIDYTGRIKVNGKKVKFDGGSASDQTADIAASTVGGSTMIDGFVDALKGHSVGDKFTKKLKFPKSYGQSTEINGKTIDLSGKVVWFTYKVKSLQKTVTPELDDAFVKENYESEGLTTVKEYKAYQKKQLRNNKIMNGLWQDYLDDCKVAEYDQDALDEYESEAESSIVAQYSSYGITDLTTYLEACGMSEDDWHEQTKESIKSRMVIYAIADKEDIDIDKLYKDEGDDYAQQNYGADIDTLTSSYGEDTVKETITLNLIVKKIMEVICDNVEVKKGSAPTTTAEETTTEASTTAEETTAEETTEAATTK